MYLQWFTARPRWYSYITLSSSFRNFFSCNISRQRSFSVTMKHTGKISRSLWTYAICKCKNNDHYPVSHQRESLQYVWRHNIRSYHGWPLTYWHQNTKLSFLKIALGTYNLGLSSEKRNASILKRDLFFKIYCFQRSRSFYKSKDA